MHSTAASYDGYGIYGGKENEAFDGYIYGGRSNVNRGQENVIVGGHHNEMLYDFGDENNPGDYNRWSVIVGGIDNQLPASSEDYSSIIGLMNRTFIGQPYWMNVPNENLHIQVGPANE